MSSTTFPTPYFNGIVYNPAQFSSATGYITQLYADNQYLSRVGTPFSNATLTTFTGSLNVLGNISAGNINVVNATGIINCSNDIYGYLFHGNLTAPVQILGPTIIGSLSVSSPLHNGNLVGTTANVTTLNATSINAANITLTAGGSSSVIDTGGNITAYQFNADYAYFGQYFNATQGVFSPSVTTGIVTANLVGNTANVTTINANVLAVPSITGNVTFANNVIINGNLTATYNVTESNLAFTPSNNIFWYTTNTFTQANLCLNWGVGGGNDFFLDQYATGNLIYRFGNPTPTERYRMNGNGQMTATGALNSPLHNGNLVGTTANVTTLNATNISTSVVNPSVGLTNANYTGGYSSGTVQCSMPFQGTGYKKATLYVNAFQANVGVTAFATYPFPTGFTLTPVSSVNTLTNAPTVTITTGQIVITSPLGTTPTSGYLSIEGY